MKFAVEYSQFTSEKLGVKDALLEKIDEIDIDWDPQDLTLLEFLQKYKNKRINIIINNNEDFEKYKLLSKIATFKEEFPELDIAFAFRYNLVELFPEVLEQIKQKNIKFYYNYAICDWEEFNVWMKSGISDMVIGNQLCFELEKCRMLANEYGFRLRTDIGVVQKKYITTEDYCSFFIRPEDIDKYSKFIDVFNLYFSKLENPRDLNVLFDIYSNDKYWYGNLQEILPQLINPLDSRCLLSSFVNNRINCGRKCLSGSSCKICKNQMNLAKTLSDNNLMLEDKK